jgi:hypothetical protein
VPEKRDTIESDHARDQDDHARDQDDHPRDHDKHPRYLVRGGVEYQFAPNYPDPTGKGPLQLWPYRTREEFDSFADFFAYIDAVTRWNSGLPPPRRLPGRAESAIAVPEPSAPGAVPHRRAVKARHVGVRLTNADYELLAQLARAHAVPPGTMARMLVVRGIRAVADREEDRG